MVSMHLRGMLVPGPFNLFRCHAVIDHQINYYDTSFCTVLKAYQYCEARIWAIGFIEGACFYFF